MKCVFILLILCAVLMNIYCSKKIDMITVDRADVCSIPANSPFSISEIMLSTKNHRTYINTSFNITRVIPSIKAVLQLNRCKNREQLDSCIPFGKFPIDNGCLIMQDGVSIMAGFFDAIKPPLKCPMQKGQYQVKDCSFDPSMGQIFPMGNWYWKSMIDHYDKESNEFLFRMCLDLKIVPYYV